MIATHNIFSLFLPVKEGLFAVASKPFGIIKVEIVPISMTGIDLFHIRECK